MLSRDQVRVAAGNLLLAYWSLQQLPDGLPIRVRLEERFAWLCEDGAGAGLADSPAELELMVADVVEVLPMPSREDHGGPWLWLMQARWILGRRLLERVAPAAAA